MRTASASASFGKVLSAPATLASAPVQSPRLSCRSSYDFVEDQTHNGRKCRMLDIIDEFSRQCLAMVPLRRFRSNDVIDGPADLFIEHGPPQHIRSDNGPEFARQRRAEWLGRLGGTTLYIEPLPTARAGNDQDAGMAARLGYAPSPAQPGIRTAHQLTKPDQSSRAVQGRRRRPDARARLGHKQVKAPSIAELVVPFGWPC